MNSYLPRTRADALYRETTRFQTGRACGRGHIAPRFTANGNCVRCEAERRRPIKMKENTR